MSDVLKDLLGELYTDEIEKKVGGAKLIILDEGKFIPISKFNAKLDEIKQQKEVIDDYKKQLKEIEKRAKGNEELENTIKELRADNEKKDLDYQKTIAAKEKDFAIQNAIKDAQGKNVKAITALLDMDKITVDDKGITGLSDQLKVLKESDAYLFGEDKIVGSPGHIPEGDKGTPQPKDLDARIKEAEDKGDYMTSIALKREKYEGAKETKK